MRFHLPRRRPAIAAAAVLSVAAAMLTVLAPAASAATLNVSYTLEMCNLDTNGAVYDPTTKTCNEAGYTTGNLGKGWAELDLVPARVTLDNNGGTASGQFVVAGDYKDASGPATGWDFISALTLDTANSDATCTAVVSGAYQVDPPSPTTSDQIIDRTITATVPAGATCVYNFYYRIALGAHNYPGSKMQANLLNPSLGTAGIGEKHISVNSGEFAPQSIEKDMSATQDSDHIWNVTKDPTPATLDLGDTCDPTSTLSATVDVKVSWEKLPATASGDITVITHVYAANPASREVTVNVTDVIKSGTTTVLNTVSAGPTDVPPNTASFLLLTHTITVPDGTTDLNDIATATYTDKVTGLAIPGTTTDTASATVQSSGTTLNDSATINDVESITGTGLSFSTDGFTGATGDYDNSYVEGTPTTGSVSWTSDSQGDTGSVTFHKTVYATAGTAVSGKLSDTATLTGVDGFTTDFDLDITVSSSASVSLTVNKSIPDVLTGSESATFTFDVTGPGGYVSHPTITFTAGETSDSTTLSGLVPGAYSVAEQDQTGWVHQTAKNKTISLPSCSGSVSFVNDNVDSSARVRKVTVPAGGEAGWSFTLNGPGAGANGETVVTTGTGYVDFTTPLQEGSYTITETAKAGYDFTSASSECSFTVNYPAAAHVYSCTYTNTAQGSITVKKATVPAGASGTFTFTGDAAGSIGDGGTITVSNLAPGTYTSTETVPTGWDLTDLSCTDSDSGGTVASKTATFKLAAGENITCTFTNTARGSITVKKVTDPTSSTQKFAFTGDAAGSIGNNETITVDVAPGTYHSTETLVTGWDLTGIACNDSNSTGSGAVATFIVAAGENVTCTFTNRQRGKARVVKTVDGLAPSGTQSFPFEIRQGASAAAAGTILETGTATAGNGGTINFSTSLTPGATYQLCEQVMPGWLNNFQPPFFTVYNPSGDNSVLCTDFTVSAGETKVFNIDNRKPPGGLARTIGFWKNWASCAGSNGKQKPVLDQTLAAAGGHILIGVLDVDRCSEAVSILNKSTLSGKKMASDPSYNLAAQLLAAKLNLAAGAGVCPAAATAINDAQTLLADNGFDGTNVPKLSKADVTKANSLATTLDNYNNNKLC